LDEFSGLNGVLIGSDMAFNLGLGVGDEIRVIPASANHRVSMGFVPRHKDFKVLGIFKLGISHYDSNLVIMPFDGAGRLFKFSENEASGVEVEIDNFENARLVADKINGIFGLFAADWKEENASFLNAINVQASVMRFILSLFLIVSVFMIFGLMSSMINAKAKQIAILRALGYSRTDIMFIFIWIGGVICVSGIGFGILCGVSFALNIEVIKNFLESVLGVKIFDGAFYFLSYLPSKVYAKDIFFTVLFALICGLLAVFLATRKAQKLPPSLAMKYE
jgi:lipoprotein-releasing system permease protein